MKKRLILDTKILNLEDISEIKSDVLIVGCYEGSSSGEIVSAIDKSAKGIIKKLIKRGDHKGSIGSKLSIPAILGINAQRLLLLGCGKKGKTINSQDAIKIISNAIQGAKETGGKNAYIVLPKIKVKGKNDNWIAYQIGMLAESACYIYEPKIGKSKKTTSKLKKINIAFTKKDEVNSSLKKSLLAGQITGQGVNAAKDLGNLPGNICTPSYLADAAKNASKEHSNLSCKVLGEKEMSKLGLDCLLSVGNGSIQESKLICLNYKGAKKVNKPFVLVGKGITFDTGGISLKPGNTMDEMKYDMCGAASVIGVLQIVASMKLPINVIGLIPAAENMPGSKATKPGDVVKTLSGQTVEILNTDAEGRLVLADALTYAKRFNPETVVDIATLTGACLVALGNATSGLLSNNDNLAKSLFEAGLESGDRAWQLPLWDIYQKDLDSNFADIANIGGRAGTITAACFLSRFTQDFKWAHLDVAGTAWVQGKMKGATGRPVPLLTQYLLDQIK